MKKLVLPILTMLSLGAFAQAGLVHNSSFESILKKVKTAGAIEQTETWSSPTGATADLFTAYAKNDEYSVPDNYYGNSDANSGEAYAGIVTYSDKGAVPNSYIHTKLRETLEEGKIYCVSFHIKLSSLSKYASNNLGIHLSNKMLSVDNFEDPEEEKPVAQIMHSENPVFEDQYEWQKICKPYTAEGGERYLALGNFSDYESTQTQKIKKPKGMIGQQHKVAYYYIDDVNVINMAGLETCDCERDAGGYELAVKYSKNVSTEIEAKDAQLIELTKIYFEPKGAQMGEKDLENIQKVADLLKANEDYTITITGHTDPLEELRVTGDVSMNRAEAVKAKLEELGIDATRMETVGKKDASPSTTDATPAGQAQNRRAEFEVSK